MQELLYSLIGTLVLSLVGGLGWCSKWQLARIKHLETSMSELQSDVKVQSSEIATINKEMTSIVEEQSITRESITVIRENSAKTMAVVNSIAQTLNTLLNNRNNNSAELT